MENLRDIRQKEFAREWLKSKFGILLVSPRMGKTRIAIYALQEMNNPSILIAYPDNKIKQSWINEFEIMNYDSSNVTFTTHLSLHKYKEQKFDVVILDELHLLSTNQLLAAYELLKLNKVVMGLTGTLAKTTKKTISDTLSLPVIAEYSIEQAIDENIIADYEITVVQIPLDNKIRLYNGKTEKQIFDSLSWVIDKLVAEGKDTFFLRLRRMRIIQNSIAKISKTRQLIDEYKKERLLVFTGLTKVADSLQIPAYHNKCSDKSTFKDFVNGDIQYLAVCKIGATGITYSHLNRVIMNYTNSNPEDITQKVNRCLSMEYDNPDKKGLITIVSSNEDVEASWIRKGLSFFNKSKIKYL